MKRSDRVVVKFKSRKQENSSKYKHKSLGTKSPELANLKCSGRLFISESMSHENQQFAHKCRKLKSAWKIHLAGSLCCEHETDRAWKNTSNTRCNERREPFGNR